MAEYIERQALLNKLKERDICLCVTEQDIKDAPAADVAPVRHGRWYGYTCTSCNLPWDYNMRQNAEDWGYFDPMPNYCPNCGARMDLEV